MQVDLNLPQSKSPLHIAETKADAVVFHTEPNLKRDREEFGRLAQCDVRRNEGGTSLAIALWACEHKQKGTLSKDRLAKDLVSALWQRRALGMGQQIVYGMTADPIYAVVYAAWWKDVSTLPRSSLNEVDLDFLGQDWIHFRPIQTFNFTNFGQVVQFYLLFHRILQYGEQCLAEYRNVTTEQLRVARAAVEGSWRVSGEATRGPVVDKEGSEWIQHMENWRRNVQMEEE